MYNSIKQLRVPDSGEPVSLNLQDVKNVVIYGDPVISVTVYENGNPTGLTLANNGVYVLFGVTGFGGLAPSIWPNQELTTIQLNLVNNGAAPATVTVKEIY